MSVEFDTPANRIIAQQAPKNQFRIDTTLPDIAFLRQLSNQGRLIFRQGTFTGTTTGNIVEFTPANGTTFFFLSAVFANAVASGITFIMHNDGMTREQVTMPPQSVHNVAMKMDSLTGDGIKVFDIEVVTATSGTKTASLFGWIENTSRIRDVAT